MTRGTDVLDFYYDASGIPVALKYDDTTYYYLTTLQGDVLLVLDEDGEIAVSYDYDAWGKILAIGGSMATTLGTLNPLTYRGYVYDHETGLYYLQSRYYNPEWGRFINSDTFAATGQGLLGNNMFAYCGNNPVSRSDDGGYFWDIVFDVVSLVVSVIEVVNNPNDVGAWVGLACDVIDVAVPCVGGLGEAARAVDTALDAADTVLDVADTVDDIYDTAKVVSNAGQAVDNVKTGWRVGDDITNLTKAGNTPSWSTVRQRYWKNEAFYNGSNYSDEALDLMKRGRAPIVDGRPMELHHPNGRDGSNFWDFYPLTHDQHHFEHYGW